MTLADLRAQRAEIDQEAERLRLVGDMSWCRLWVYFVHAHRDLWSVLGGWESHGDHVAFVEGLSRLHVLRCRLWALSDPATRGSRPAASWHEQVRRHGGFGDPR